LPELASFSGTAVATTLDGFRRPRSTLTALGYDIREGLDELMEAALRHILGDDTPERELRHLSVPTDQSIGGARVLHTDPSHSPGSLVYFPWDEARARGSAEVAPRIDGRFEKRAALVGQVTANSRCTPAVAGCARA
jgi:hypothetical protein